MKYLKNIWRKKSWGTCFPPKKVSEIDIIAKQVHFSPSVRTTHTKKEKLLHVQEHSKLIRIIQQQIGWSNQWIEKKYIEQLQKFLLFKEIIFGSKSTCILSSIIYCTFYIISQNDSPSTKKVRHLHSFEKVG